MNSQPTLKRRYFPPRISLQVVMIYLTLFCFFCGLARLVTYHDEATNISAEEANQRFSKAWTLLRLPNDASHVNMYASSQSGGADFDISADGFRNWCWEQGWKLEENKAVQPEPPYYYAIGPGDGVRHGYYFSNATHRGGFTVMYDINRQRAWVHLSPR